jgi:hypothetical protein
MGKGGYSPPPEIPEKLNLDLLTLGLSKIFASISKNLSKNLR